MTRALHETKRFSAGKWACFSICFRYTKTPALERYGNSPPFDDGFNIICADPELFLGERAGIGGGNFVNEIMVKNIYP